MSDSQFIGGNRSAIVSGQTSPSTPPVIPTTGFSRPGPIDPEASGVIPGTPVYFNGGVTPAILEPALATTLELDFVPFAINQSNVEGLASSVVNTTPGAPQKINVITSGPLTLTQAQWDAVLESSLRGGLNQGTAYYLSAVEPGKITPTIPVGGTFGVDDSSTIAVPIMIGTCISVTDVGEKSATLQIDIQAGSYGDRTTTTGGGPGVSGSPLSAHASGEFNRFLLPGFAIPGNAILAGSNALALATTLDGCNVKCLADWPAGIDSDGSPTVYVGRLTLTHAQWNAVVDGGAAGGLMPGVKYYLSAATPGNISTVIPNSPNFVLRIGVADSDTDLIVQIGDPVVGPSA